METITYKGYFGSVEYSEEDGCMFGKVQGLHGTLISYEGLSLKELEEDFHNAVDHYLRSCTGRNIDPIKPHC